MIRMKIISLFFCGLLSLGLSQAQQENQQAKSDLLKINQLFLEQYRYEVDVEYKWFDKHTDKEPLGSQQIKIQKQGEMTHIHYPDNEKLQNGKYLITVFHDRKLIMLEKAKRTPATALEEIPFDSLLLLCDKVEYEAASFGKNAAYNFRFSEYQFSTIRLEFDPLSHLIKKLIMIEATEDKSIMEGDSAMEDDPASEDKSAMEDRSDTKDRSVTEGSSDRSGSKLEVTFSNFKTDVKFSSDTFSEKQFVKQTAGENPQAYTPISRFSDYRLVSFLNK